MAEAKRVLTFHSDAVEDETLQVLELAGTEEISRYFVFNLELVSTKVDVKFEDMLKKAARLEIKQGVKLAGGDKRGIQTLKIHGVLRSFEQVEQRHEWVRYRAELVPTLWRLSLTYRSRIFLEKTVVEIAKEVLKEYGLADQDDFEFRCSDPPKREFVMQYEESDLDFLDRWLEREGIFYFWEHSDSGSKLVFADSTAAYQPIQGTPTIQYKPLGDADNRVEAGESDKASEDWFREEIIPVFTFSRRVVPKKVVLSDYNWRKPTEPLVAEHNASDNGDGFVYEYNNHYKTKDEGKKVAQIRSEEILAREIVYSGESDCRSFRAGATYTLDKHYRSDLNNSHLLVEVRHEASQSVELGSKTINAKYRNSFRSIPADRTYRPPQRTAWPKISGFLSAVIDASGDGKYAEIDDMGRYKVKFPLDLSDKKDGKASRYLRMLQPYAGGGMGMHFPLHKGTEVAVMFLDGDPDRPIIAGAIPNPDTSSPVAGGNQTQCKIQTGGGNVLQFEDNDGSQQITIHSPKEGTTLTFGA